MVKCDGCIQCCRFGSSIEARPTLTPLEAKRFNHVKHISGTRILTTPAGDCYYLTDIGCGVYSERPQHCREFDCLTFNDELCETKDHFTLRVLVESLKHDEMVNHK
ncbi:hypothetical protein MNBD_GAMMA12-2628 [hydrothermal vent metagenome]|uniref:YkgJ family cysteine cluster protein n=1 Tax=hydrothermal vent metagenome TaxID=652676 RepID=A0A3B0Z6C8_9ZZZZ